MKYFSVLFLAGVLTAQAPPLTDQRVIDLSKTLKPDELTRLIASAPQVSFDLTPSAEQQMLAAGVSESTIRAMASRELGSPAVSNAPTPISQPVVSAKRSHRVRNWVIIAVAAGAASYGGYALSNPHAGGLGCLSCSVLH